MTEYKVEMRSPKDGWETPIKLGTAEADTPMGAIQKVMRETTVSDIAYHMSYDSDEVVEVYSDGLELQAAPVVATKKRAKAVYDEGASIWTIQAEEG